MRRHKKKILMKTALVIFIIYYLCKRIHIYIPISKSNDIEYDLEKLHMKYHMNLIDWHDRTAMAADRLRTGLGEQGVPTIINLSDAEKSIEKDLYSQNGFNAHLSDKISLHRSVPDIRNKLCNTIKYLSKLPNVSVIIIFYNEHWSTLLRTVYSVLRRSPEHLIYEIILVDDGSEKKFLGTILDIYVSKNIPKVKIVRHRERKGLIAARITGAKVATGVVMLFLDSHCEPNYNWLPPLLEPIAYNPKIVACPFIDYIEHDTFEYKTQDAGRRGGFDWEFHYKRLPLLPDDIKNPTKPFRNPVMAGGLFAINRKWFWELGGYDPGLDIWGGEQYELSFKVWMCGGAVLDVPCSRVGHIYRGKMNSTNPRTTDFIHINYKRVAEVWMDEYAEFLYKRDNEAFDAIDVGDMSDRRAIRKRLKCKSFKWFMETIAFDTLIHYPLVDPPSYATGIIRSIADQIFCLDTMDHGQNEEPGLYPCSEDSLNGYAEDNQNWEISWRKDLRLPGAHLCLDAPNHHTDAKLMLYTCHDGQGNQCWFYDHSKKLLVQGVTGYCLEANIKNRTVYINKCNDANIFMKWEFSFYNATGLERFYIDWPKP